MNKHSLGKRMEVKFKGLIAVTVCLVIITLSAIVYEKSLLRGRYDEQGRKLFRLCETEPSEPYLELKDPLDKWTAQALQDLSQSVSVEEQYWNQCQITNSTATVFKYGEKFYTFTSSGIDTYRRVEIHVDPINEVHCGDAISISKTTYSPNNPCYELHDPLDPWTEAAIEDPINVVWIDDIYLDQCALLKPNVTTILEQRPIYKYHSEYYTLDFFGFYDDFGLKPKRLIRPLITISWIVLGCFWLGSCLYELKKSRSKVKPELTTLEACNRLALTEGQKENKNERRNKNGSC
jgi:hypothetical protein